MLVRLLYASRAVDPSPDVIEDILAQSRQFNPSCGITGILCYGGGIFLQALEGGRMAVSDLYGHIQKDPRHKDVVLLHYEEISERRFGGWTMGQVNVADQHQHPAEVRRARRARSLQRVGVRVAGAARRAAGHGLHHRPGLTEPGAQ
jgi:hypothetical protein